MPSKSNTRVPRKTSRAISHDREIKNSHSDGVTITSRSSIEEKNIKKTRSRRLTSQGIKEREKGKTKNQKTSRSHDKNSQIGSECKRRRIAARSLSYSNMENRNFVDGINNENSATDQSNDDQEYEVEKIIDEDKAGNVKVKWVGYSRTSWEPLSSIPVNFYTQFQKSYELSKLSSQKTARIKLKRVEPQASQASTDTQINDNKDSESPTSDDREYQVEKIVNEDKDGNVEVKWVGFTTTSWEPLMSIPKHFYSRFKNASRSELPSNHNRSKAFDENNSNSDTVLPTSATGCNGINGVASTALLVCALCHDEEKSGRVCANCGKSVHHMCSNALVDENNLEEVNDACFCSVPCYNSSRGISQSHPQAPQKSSHTGRSLCAVCDEEERSGRCCDICKTSVHIHCSNEILDELSEKSRDATFCSRDCYARRGIPAMQEMVGKQSRSISQSRGITKKKIKTIIAASRKTATATLELEPVVGHSIAFSPSCEDWMSSALYGRVGTLFLAGMVTRQSKNKGGVPIPDRYEIAWSSSEFQGKNIKPLISHAKACEGKRNFERMMGGHLKSSSWDKLCLPLEDGINIDADWDEFDVLDESLVRYETNQALPLDLAEVEKLKTMDFRTEANIVAPANLYCHEDGSSSTRLRSEHRILFEQSASSSFLALLPLAFWRKIVENTNLYAVSAKQPLVSLDEMMKFLGILFYISTVDKGEYANYWGDQIENKMFGEVSSGLDRVMTLRRFKFIRQNLSFREGVTLAELQSDPAARIRPLIKILRARAPKFVELGRNVAVDESSIACRSKYGRHMIVYNNSKPTGKYHFKIYAMCCSETWFAVSFRLHCASDLEKRLAGVVDQNAIESFREATKTSTLIRKHVLEVVMPINYTYRVVNTDNFYTSVQLLEALRVVGLYGRGTIRADSKYSPKFLMMKKNDNMTRGTIRQGVEVNHKMVGASWCDGSIVNILSTADASTIATVERTIGRSKISFPAPACVREYNKYMQGVDRIDQLRGRFSIADGHTFKKWHKKLAMAYIDIARCNAFIARKMTGVYASARDPHREFMIELSSQLIHGEWEVAIGDNGIMYSDPTPMNNLQSPGARSSRPPSPAGWPSQCSMKHSSDVFPDKRDKRGCVVCRFEGRFPSQQSMFCTHHKVPLCLKRRECGVVKSYMCPDTDLSCWDKYHSFYFTSGVFNINGNVCRTSALFRDMKRQKAQSRLPSTIREDDEINTSPDVTHTPPSNQIRSRIPSNSDTFNPSDSSGIFSEEFQSYRSDMSFSDHSSIDFGEMNTNVGAINQAIV